MLLRSDSCADSGENRNIASRRCCMQTRVWTRARTENRVEALLRADRCADPTRARTGNRLEALLRSDSLCGLERENRKSRRDVAACGLSRGLEPELRIASRRCRVRTRVRTRARTENRVEVLLHTQTHVRTRAGTKIRVKVFDAGRPVCGLEWELRIMPRSYCVRTCVRTRARTRIRVEVFAAYGLVRALRILSRRLLRADSCA